MKEGINKFMQYLILGASGYIGSYLYDRMKQDGFAVTGTVRKRTDNSEMRKYDMETDDLKGILSDMPRGEKTAVLCAGNSSIDQCCTDYEQNYFLNVTRSQAVIEELLAEGFRIIYFSTDHVFDGMHGNYTEEDETHAINCYGRMKEEMERFLLEKRKPVFIARLSKVVSAQWHPKNLFYEWSLLQEKGEPIYCIKDNRLSFIALEDIYQACLISNKNKLSGLYHIVGNQAYTRKELAELFFRIQGTETQKIEERSIDAFAFQDRRPLDTSMSNWKFCQETGFCFSSMEQAIKEYLKEK